MVGSDCRFSGNTFGLDSEKRWVLSEHRRFELSPCLKFWMEVFSSIESRLDSNDSLGRLALEVIDGGVEIWSRESVEQYGSDLLQAVGMSSKFSKLLGLVWA